MFFLAKIAVVAVAQGVWFARVFGPVTGSGRATLFLAGAALAPFAIGACDLLIALALPRGAFALTANYALLLAAVLYLSALVFRCRRSIAGARAAFPRQRWDEWAGWAILAVLACYLGANFAAQIQVPLTSHDALVYANEAKAFASQGTLAAIPDFAARGDALAASHPHGFLYQAYLADAIAMDDDPEDLSDLGLRIAFQCTLIALLLAVAALASVWGGVLAVSATLSLVLFHRWLQYVSVASSADGFRVIPLLLIIALLVLLLREGAGGVRRARIQALLVALGWFAVQAHTLNVVILPIVAGAWVLCAAASRSTRPIVVSAAPALLLGALIGLLHYAKSYWDTGNVLGYGFYYYAYHGTPLWTHQLGLEGFNVEKPGVGAILWRYFDFDREYGTGFVSSRFLFVSGALALPAYLYLNWRHRADTGRMFFSAALLALLLPHLGTVDVTSLPLSKMFLVNKRYSLHVFILVAVMLADLAFNRIGGSRPARPAAPGPDGASFFPRRAAMVQVLLAVALAFMALRNVDAWYLLEERYRREENAFYRARDFLRTLPRDSVVLIDHLGVDYYSDVRTRFVYARGNWDLLRAGSKPEVAALLRERGVRYVLLQRGMENWWNYVPLGQVLGDPQYAKHVYAFKEWRGYEVLR